MEYDLEKIRLRERFLLLAVNNLIAYVFGDYLNNFSTLNSYCRFFDCTQKQLANNSKLEKLILKSQRKRYHYNIENIQEDV